MAHQASTADRAEMQPRQQAIAAFEAKKLDEAEALCRETQRLRPGHFDVCICFPIFTAFSDVHPAITCSAVIK
jgi:hypothetical protein